MTEEEITKAVAQLSEALAIICIQTGPLSEDGRSILYEAKYNVGDFLVDFWPDESKHRGLPHCLIRLPNKLQPKLNIKTGGIIEGEYDGWGRSIQKFADQHRDELLAIWDATRPDDQRIPPQKDSSD